MYESVSKEEWSTAWSWDTELPASKTSDPQDGGLRPFILAGWGMLEAGGKQGIFPIFYVLSSDLCGWGHW